MLNSAITLDRLTRYFGKRSIIRDLDMRVPQGQVTAMLGLNGVGKTTAIRIMMGLLRPTRGRCEILGENSADLSTETRMRIGYLVEGHYLYPSMRVRECGRFQSAGYSRWDDHLFDQILVHFGIPPSARIGRLSRGQRAGVALALVLAPDPELLVLDDPALGLDPVSRRALNETLVEFAGDGRRTVLLSTHLLDDVERVADRVAVLVDGRLKVETTIDDFRSRVSGIAIEVAVADPLLIATIPGLVEARRIGSRLHISVVDADQETTAAIGRLNATSVESIDMTLTDGVLAYLNRSRQDTSFFNHDRTGVAS